MNQLPRLIRVWADMKSDGNCRACGKPVVWRVTAKNGKNVPFDPEAITLGQQRDPERGTRFDMLSSEHCHFATCSKARRPPATEGQP